MKKLYVRKKFSILLLLAFVLIACKDTFGQGPPENLPKDRDNAIGVLKNTIENVSQEKPKVFTTSDKYVRFMMAPPGTSFAVAQEARSSPQQAANWFFNNWSGLFVNYSPRTSFKIIRDKVDNSKNHYVRYQQYYNGLEVKGAQLNCMVNASGGVVAILSDIMRNTESLDNGKVSLNPNINQSGAQKKATENISKEYSVYQLEATKSELKIFDPKVAGLTGEPKLVWETIVSDKSKIRVKENVLVDAGNGEIVNHNSLISYSNPLPPCLIYDVDTQVIYRDEYDVYNQPHPVYVDLAEEYLEDVWDFFAASPFNRNGWNNQGTSLFIKFKLDQGGAIWGDGGSITLGYAIDEGSVIWHYANDDTIGHEFTHGVYNTEVVGSGDSEIEESFADMFGEWIDQLNQSGTDTEGVKWKLFEDAWGGVDWDRNMKDPHDANAEEKGAAFYGEPNYWDTYTSLHQRALVGDKLCYLLTDGNDFRGYSISGMGIPDASSLFYHCLRYWLLGNSDYYDLGFCLQMSAVALNFSPSQRLNVENACRAVNIYSEKAFEFKNSSGITVGFFDDDGDLFLMGDIITGTPSPNQNKDEFIIRTTSDIVAMVDLETGDMTVHWYDPDGDERLSQGEMNLWANGFIIKNDDGDVVTYIDGNGCLKQQYGRNVYYYRN